jgi:hypothetical protein
VALLSCWAVPETNRACGQDRIGAVGQLLDDQDPERLQVPEPLRCSAPNTFWVPAAVI